MTSMGARMERPVSVASSHTSHRRGPSVATINNKPTAVSNDNAVPIPATLQALSTPALFVNNLRLLDFDLLPDWPNITAVTFSNQDARARIRGTEFALFQLFRYYDPMITSEKLQPFFPPLEPLQSINLRAALYRCLNDLKKNGVLGKETVLRKSMLDDCQGDKFWELCLTFSATVLRKVTLSRAAKYGRSAAEQIGLAQHVYAPQLDSMLPLAVAHRTALKRVLREKQRTHDMHVKLYNTLIQKEAELQQRKAHAQEQARKRPYTSGLENVDVVERKLGQILGDQNVLYRTVVHGDNLSSTDNLLINPFEELWISNRQGTTSHDDTTKCVLESLQHRATLQSQRIRRWQSKYEQLMASAATSTTSKPRRDTQDVRTPQFNQHRGLTVRDAPEITTHLPEISHNPKVARYDEILTAMRDELRRTRQRDGSGPVPVQIQRVQTMPAVPMRKSSTASEMLPDVAERENRSMSTTSASSNTAVPVRPSMFARRLPSRSRSYQQPKVDSQRQPIPLKSEIFSPLKTQPSNISPISSARSVLPSPLEAHDLVEDGSDGAIGDRPLSLSSDAIGTVDSAVAFGMERERLDDFVGDYTIPAVKPQRNSGPTKRPSLADRTRMSMEMAGTDQYSSVSETDASDPTIFSHSVQAPDHEDMESPCSRLSLAERTRRSILLAPAFTQTTTDRLPQTPQPSTHRGADFDETPIRVRKTRPASDFEDKNVQSDRSLTPHEQLFSPEAEYESVFKARPKVALSPLLSAQKRPDSGRVSLEYNDLMLSGGGQM